MLLLACKPVSPLSESFSQTKYKYNKKNKIEKFTIPKAHRFKF